MRFPLCYNGSHDDTNEYGAEVIKVTYTIQNGDGSEVEGSTFTREFQNHAEMIRYESGPRVLPWLYLVRVSSQVVNE